MSRSVPCIIQLRVGDRAEAEKSLRRLRSLGVELDDEYGLIPLDPEDATFASRGLIPESMLTEIGDDDRIDVFPDVGIQPIRSPGKR